MIDSSESHLLTSLEGMGSNEQDLTADLCTVDHTPLSDKVLNSARGGTETQQVSPHPHSAHQVYAELHQSWLQNTFQCQWQK